MAVVHRFDTIDAPSWSTEPFKKTPEGYLKGRACITSTGIFRYQMADGSIVNELRLPEEVFAEATLDSYKLKPVTNEHPREKVTAENIKQYQVGNLGDNPQNVDNTYLAIDMVIQDATAIADVMAGKRSLSVGYDVTLEETSGEFCGQHYDRIQRGIMVNHTALCEVARQGDQAKIRLDSADAVLINSEEIVKEEPVMAEATNVVVKVDASEVQNLIKAEKDRADSLQSNLDTLTTEKVKIEAERDTLKDSLEKANLKITALAAARVDEKAIEAAIARRVRILDAATKAGIEIKDMKEPEIQKAVVLKVFPKANFDGKDQVYLDARFDGAVEQLAEVDVADAEVRKLNADGVDSKEDKKEAPNADKAREAYIARLTKKDKV